MARGDNELAFCLSLLAIDAIEQREKIAAQLQLFGDEVQLILVIQGNDDKAVKESIDCFPRAGEYVTILDGGLPGLSKSRNLALQAATAPYVIFGDWDASYDWIVVMRTVSMLRRSGSSAAVTRPDSELRNRCSEELARGAVIPSLTHVATPTVVWNALFLKQNQLSFDSNMGINGRVAILPFGEEFKLLADSFACGGGIDFASEPICVVERPGTGKKANLFHKCCVCLYTFATLRASASRRISFGLLFISNKIKRWSSV